MRQFDYPNPIKARVTPLLAATFIQNSLQDSEESGELARILSERGEFNIVAHVMYDSGPMFITDVVGNLGLNIGLAFHELQYIDIFRG